MVRVSTRSTKGHTTKKPQAGALWKRLGKLALQRVKKNVANRVMGGEIHALNMRRAAKKAAARVPASPAPSSVDLPDWEAPSRGSPAPHAPRAPPRPVPPGRQRAPKRSKYQQILDEQYRKKTQINKKMAGPQFEICEKQRGILKRLKDTIKIERKERKALIKEGKKAVRHSKYAGEHKITMEQSSRRRKNKKRGSVAGPYGI